MDWHRAAGRPGGHHRHHLERAGPLREGTDGGPGKFAEACGKLERGNAVARRFEAGGPLDFNIHYHEGKAVRYPASRKAVAAVRGELKVALDQDYCWMWTNKSQQPVDLRFTLTR
ncbi:hypothetical protein FSC37_10570 [Piscinibacter aquaticus]|uniref:Uncharacterized protein n=1 Tax=Piscinibacter aquaticus TaxID=392597 RepID=A0A5C6U0D5_9BURK|nr:hypothetical protein FSC37_10570 [Piscinibacter aquaticus]